MADDSVDVADTMAGGAVLDKDQLNNRIQNLEKTIKDMEVLMTTYPGRYGGTLVERLDFETPDPVKGARVPLDSVPDYAFYYRDNPDTGGLTTPPQISVQHQEDEVRSAKMHELLTQITDRIKAKAPNTGTTELMNQYQIMKAQSPSFQKTERELSGRIRSHEDADIIQQAIDAYLR